LLTKFAACVQKFVKPAAMNARSMITTIAKNVPKPALNAQKNAGKWLHKSGEPAIRAGSFSVEGGSAINETLGICIARNSSWKTETVKAGAPHCPKTSYNPKTVKAGSLPN
jgi:hypothetical protein